VNGDNPAVDHYLAEFSALRARLPGSGLQWLSDTRQGALDRFAGLGFPTPRLEDWRYTRVAPIEKRSFHAALGAAEAPDGAEIERHLLPGLDCQRLVFIDGRYVEALSTRPSGADGVRVASLAHVIESSPELLEQHLGRYADADRHAFAALNTAFMADGAVVHVAAGKSSEHPIHLLFIASGEEVVSHPRVLVVAEQGSRATVIESYASRTEGCYFTNALTEVALAEGARVEHYKLQEESTKAFHIATLQAHQAHGTHFASHSISFGAQIARNDITVTLDAENTFCVLNGLFMVDGRQHVDFHTLVDHAKPHGSSEETYKGILGGRSRGVFNGRIIVRPDAQKTDAHQSNNNLLLSRDAEIDTKPQLEIYADDVKCSHGATVGQLDEQMLFYLRSRGIGENEARGLLTYGFARDILERVEIAALRDKATNGLLQRMPDADHIREIVQ
jgi:Fe-S cluster assembly protein SufD